MSKMKSIQLMRNTSNDSQMRNLQTKRTENIRKIAQRAKERAMLGISLIDRYRSTRIRLKTRVKYRIPLVKQEKWRWARHIARMIDDR